MYTVSSKKSFYIPEGMTVTGTFTTDVPGQIAGAVNGDVCVNGRLVILKSAVIIGNVKAQELEVWGRVIGYIQCSGKLFLQKASFVKGNISTVEIYIEKDAIVDGIIIKPGQNNTEEKFVPTTLKEPSIEIVAEPVIQTEEPFINTGKDEEEQSWF